MTNDATAREFLKEGVKLQTIRHNHYVLRELRRRGMACVCLLLLTGIVMVRDAFAQLPQETGEAACENSLATGDRRLVFVRCGVGRDAMDGGGERLAQ